jgi:hypothetical protein
VNSALRISSCWSQTAKNKTNKTEKYSIICFMLDDAFRFQSEFNRKNVFVASHLKVNGNDLRVEESESQILRV